MSAVDEKEQSDSSSSHSSPSAVERHIDNNQLISLFQPVLYGLEEQVHRVASSQVELRAQLDSLLGSLREIKNRVEQDSLVAILDDKSKRLIALKRRLT